VVEPVTRARLACEACFPAGLRMLDPELWSVWVRRSVARRSRRWR